MKIVCFVLVLLIASNCQFGGDSGSSDSGGDYSSSSDDYSDSDNDNSGSSECDEACYGSVIGIFGSIFLIVGLRFLYSRGSIRRERNNLVDDFFKQNSLCQQQWMPIKEILLANYQDMNYIQQQKQVNVRILDKSFEIVRKDEVDYLELKIKTEDEAGIANLIGQIIFSKEQYQIFFFKDYQDKAKAGQNGDYQILVYKGDCTNLYQGFKGSWYFPKAINSTAAFGNGHTEINDLNKSKYIKIFSQQKVIIFMIKAKMKHHYLLLENYDDDKQY